ncbi:uncharacterized protein LOC135924477 [Gordionus sp. m RMFG-2023]|uniref:uncharacterized protein LOC135924477 n=1 Tax=Gordionus sp. m RMFG-2023 TaxID=3053472 RepID=UPI0031FC9C8E
MDDVLITGVAPEQHNRRLGKVFQRIREKGLLASREKSVLGVMEVVYLGHRINGVEVRPLDKNMIGIGSMVRPKFKAELQSFVGMVNYYHRFIKDFAEITAPLYKLLKAGVRFEWGDEQDAAFEGLKKRIGEEPFWSVSTMSWR